MSKVLLSLVIWLVSSILTIALYGAMLAVTILFYPFDKKRKITHAQCFWWSDAIIRFNPYWKVTVKGMEHIDPKRTYIVIANHQSLADIVLAYQTKMQFKWVAKESLFAVPFVGWSMTLAKHIKLKRGDFGSIKKIYREAAIWLRGGMSVLFFPEGTRNEESAMGNFQNGAFKLAIREHVPILPVAIEGTGAAIPRGSWIFTTKTKANITILPALETTEYAPADFAKLRDQAHDALRITRLASAQPQKIQNLF